MTHFCAGIVLIICSASAISEYRYKRLRILEPRSSPKNVKIETVGSPSVVKCGVVCAETPSCVSYSYIRASLSCHLFSTVMIFRANNTNLTHLYASETTDWCPKEFWLLGDSGPCIKFYFDLKTWIEASTICSNNSPSGRVAVIDTETKFKLLSDAGMSINHLFGNAIWIGLTDLSEGNRVFKWTNGQLLGNFSAWSLSDFSGSALNACVVILRASGWKWAAASCDNARHYICEIEP